MICHRTSLNCLFALAGGIKWRGPNASLTSKLTIDVFPRKLCLRKSWSKGRNWRSSWAQHKLYSCCLQVDLRTFLLWIAPLVAFVPFLIWAAVCCCCRRFGELPVRQHIRGHQVPLQPAAAHPLRLRGQRPVTGPPVSAAGGGASVRLGPRQLSPLLDLTLVSPSHFPSPFAHSLIYISEYVQLKFGCCLRTLREVHSIPLWQTP